MSSQIIAFMGVLSICKYFLEGDRHRPPPDHGPTRRLCHVIDWGRSFQCITKFSSAYQSICLWP